MSLADLILTSEDLHPQPVETPWWPKADGQVFLRQFGGGERQRVVAWHDAAEKDYADPPNLHAKVVALSLCDASGALVFSEQQIEAFGRKNGEALRELYGKVLRLNALTKETQEDLRKNSETTPRSCCSTSSAPAASADRPPLAPTSSAESSPADNSPAGSSSPD